MRWYVVQYKSGLTTFRCLVQAETTKDAIRRLLDSRTMAWESVTGITSEMIETLDTLEQEWDELEAADAASGEEEESTDDC